MQKNTKDINIHVKQLHKQANMMKKAIDSLVIKHGKIKGRNSEEKIRQHMKIVNFSLNRVFLLLLINRIEFVSKKAKNDEIMVTARKDIAALLSKWEEQVGREFDDLHNDRLPIHRYCNNHQIFQHFQKIGCAIDFFDIHYKEAARWQTSLLAIRNRFLVCFCNALNFKSLFKQKDPSYENYIENSEIIEILKTIFEEYVQGYWNQNVKTDELNVFEMNKALSLIQFFKNFASVIEDRETHNRYKKKYIVWKKYFQERNKEEAKKIEEKQQFILAKKRAEKEIKRKTFF